MDGKKSAIAGEMERAVTAHCGLFELNGKLGLDTKLNPDAAMATARTIRMLAQIIDNYDTIRQLDRRMRREYLKLAGWFLALCGWLFFIGWLASR